VLELATTLAEQGGLTVSINVVEMDARTETVQIEVRGADIDFGRLREALEAFGASLHSIDAVDIESSDAGTED
jgi:hypothetical protein